MLERREILLSLVSLAVLKSGGVAFAAAGTLTWDGFVFEMSALAGGFENGTISQAEMEKQGLALLSRLDVNGPGFLRAVDESYESGNLYWLWQRLVKEANLKGGILNIDTRQIVALHDHVNATGMVRIIEGETEVWQYDRGASSEDGQLAELKLVSHGVLGPGDTAILTPEKGNIHALKSISAECRMLDFFIPPYQFGQRTWFEPVERDWMTSEQVLCRAIPQYEMRGA